MKHETEDDEVEDTNGLDGTKPFSESEIMLGKFANDFSQYFQTDNSVQQHKFNDSVEEMLTKLDEFCTLVDMIRGDTSLCLQKTIPEIQAKCFEMQNIFNRIDQLEKFVDIVRQNVFQMEECISKAEDDMGSFSNFKKMFTSLIGSKKAQQPKKETNFTPPNIFETERFFHSTDDKMTTESIQNKSNTSDIKQTNVKNEEKDNRTESEEVQASGVEDSAENT